MPIKLRNEWLEKIRPSLVAGIKEIRVKHGMFLDRGPNVSLVVADYHIPKASPVKKELENFVDEFPLVDFVIETLGRELYDRDQYVKDVELGPLTEIEGYEDAEATSERLLGEFQTLPWEYILSLKLPNNVPHYAPKEDFQVSDDVWLRRGGGGLEAQAPLENLPDNVAKRIAGRGLLSLIGTGPKWDADAVYLQLHVLGFIPPYGDSKPFRAAVSKMKALLGLLIAMRVVQLRAKSFGAPPREDVIVHRNLEGTYVADNRLTLEDDFYSLLGRIEAYDNNGKQKDEEIKTRWFVDDLRKVAKVFRGSGDCSSLILAGQWIFDSHAGTDPLLTYIRSMVVLEILLGSQKDAGELSIGDLIANRCAYLLGKDFKQRASIMKDLKRIYSIRSQIVHRGKAQFTLEERGLLRRLQWIGERVVQEEIARIPEAEK
jgi:hypothetical protein